MTPHKITRPEDAHRAGRFVLAVADDDGQQVSNIMQEMTEPMAFLRFALELTAISMGLARQYVGPTWRDVLGTALLDIEVQHLDQAEPEQA